MCQLGYIYLFATVIVPQPATAQTMSGVGGRDCEAFNFALEQDSEVAIDSYVAWTQGFISAFNWTNPRQRDVRVDSGAIVLWLGQFCAANPSAGIYRAVQELIANNAR